MTAPSCHETPHNGGTPHNPMSDDVLSANRLWGFDEIDDIRDLIAGCTAS